MKRTKKKSVGHIKTMSHLQMELMHAEQNLKRAQNQFDKDREEFRKFQDFYLKKKAEYEAQIEDLTQGFRKKDLLLGLLAQELSNLIFKEEKDDKKNDA